MEEGLIATPCPADGCTPQFLIDASRGLQIDSRTGSLESMVPEHELLRDREAAAAAAGGYSGAARDYGGLAMRALGKVGKTLMKATVDLTQGQQRPRAADDGEGRASCLPGSRLRPTELALHCPLSAPLQAPRAASVAAAGDTDGSSLAFPFGICRGLVSGLDGSVWVAFRGGYLEARPPHCLLRPSPDSAADCRCHAGAELHACCQADVPQAGRGGRDLHPVGWGEGMGGTGGWQGAVLGPGRQFAGSVPGGRPADPRDGGGWAPCLPAGRGWVHQRL